MGNGIATGADGSVAWFIVEHHTPVQWAHYEALHLPDGHGQRILTHTATPNTSAADALRLFY